MDIDKLLGLSYEDLLKEYNTLKPATIVDADLHFKLAGRFEELEDTDNALREYNLAVRDGCKDLKILEKMSEYYYDRGKLKNATRFLEKILEEKPGNFEVALKLTAIYEEQELLEKSKELFSNLFERTGDKRYESRLRGMETDYFKGKPAAEPKSIPDEAVLKFIDLFSGREGAYARQWANEKNETGYTPVREHFSPKVAKNHLLGNYTVGIYQLRINGTVNWSAFDVDLNKKYWQQIQTGEIDREKLLKLTFSTAMSIYRKLKECSFEPVIEYSGFKGYHIWLFFKSPLPAFQVKAFMTGILRQIEFDREKLHVEIFPKQAKVKEDGLGNLVKIPLGVHKKTGEFSYFVDEKGAKIEKHFEYLRQICKIDREIFLEKTKALKSIGREQVTRGKKEAPGGKIQVKEGKVEEFDPYTSVEFNYLISKCEVLAYIVNKLTKSNDLNNDERITLKYSFGHLNNGVEIVNSLLEQIPGIKETEFLKSKFSGNPISCPKIRKRLSEATMYLDCNCDFGEIPTYPNPLLHLRELHKADNAPLRRQEAHAVRFQNTLQQYLKLKEEINERRLHLKEIEKFFHQYFDQQDMDEVQTSIGVLKRIFHPDGQYEFIIKL